MTSSACYYVFSKTNKGEIFMAQKICSCGSELPKGPNYDARGIFLTYTCKVCHEKKINGYRKDVLVNPSYDADEPIYEY